MEEEFEWPENQLWSEDIRFPGNLHTIEINADSYNQWVKDCLFYVDQTKLEKPFERGTLNVDLSYAESLKSFLRVARRGAPFKTITDLGDGWKFGVRTLPYYRLGATDWLQLGLARNRLAIFSNEEDDCYKRGAAMFTGPVHIPMLMRNSTIWMSLTPMEIYTLREAIQEAEGHVLIAGLGMGWLTRRILESPQVTRVTQIEMEPTIARFFGEPLQELFPDRLEIVVGDVWDYLKAPDTPTFDSYIFDIWPMLGSAEDDHDFQALKDQYPDSVVWGWGDGDVCSGWLCDEPEFEEQAENEFENDQACWDKENPHEWWGLD